MAQHCGYIVKVTELRKHNNADRLQIATFFGNDTIVGLDTAIGEIGIYFPEGLQLSVEYCDANNLIRKKDDAGNNIGGYLDPTKRNITAVKLRGEHSDGLYMPLSSIKFTRANLNDLNVGDTIDVINGVEICRKYIPRTNPRKSAVGVKKGKASKHKANVAPLFMEHVDTQQLAYNLDAFKPGQQIEISLKLHGSSQRTGYLPVVKKYKRSLLDIICRKPGKPVYEMGYVSGTRRTVLEDYEGGYYGSNAFREVHSKSFEGKLWAGETVYYEVVGYTDSGVPIMPPAANKKVDKDFAKQYGETTIFSYGCEPTGEKKLYGKDEEGLFFITEKVPQSEAYVYRMTMTNQNGDVVEYTPDFMRYRCEQMGVKTVPVFWKGYIPEDAANAGEWVQTQAEEHFDGPDPVGKTHVREGVVVRVVDAPAFKAYKHKNFSFKCLAGIAVNEIKDDSQYDEDMLSEV